MNLRIKFDVHNEVQAVVTNPLGTVTGGLDEWFTMTLNTTGPYITLSTPVLAQTMLLNTTGPVANNVVWVVFYGPPGA